MAADILDTMTGNMMFGDMALSPQQHAQKRRLQNQLAELKTRLAYAKEDGFLETFKTEAANTVLKMALEALQRADPHSPLLNEEYRKGLRRQRTADLCQAHGYVFHADKGQIELKYRQQG